MSAPVMLQFEDFEPLIGTDFVLPGAEGLPSLAFTLIDAQRRGNAPRPEFRAPFSLVFKTNSSDVYGQHMYRLTHETFGTHDFFLVPLGKTADGVEYCATFS